MRASEHVCPAPSRCALLSRCTFGRRNASLGCRGRCTRQLARRGQVLGTAFGVALAVAFALAEVRFLGLGCGCRIRSSSSNSGRLGAASGRLRRRRSGRLRLASGGWRAVGLRSGGVGGTISRLGFSLGFGFSFSLRLGFPPVVLSAFASALAWTPGAAPVVHEARRQGRTVERRYIPSLRHAIPVGLNGENYLVVHLVVTYLRLVDEDIAPKLSASLGAINKTKAFGGVERLDQAHVAARRYAMQRRRRA